MATHEHTINVALGEVLAGLRPHSWRVHAEETRTLQHAAKQPDILIEEASQWPVVIEAERTNHPSAEQDALGRLGLIVNETGKPIESAIALVYPQSVLNLNGQPLRDELGRTDGLEYALYTRTIAGGEERLPESGWLNGSAKDLAMLAHRASMPAPRIERLGVVLEQGIENAAHRFTERHGSHEAGELGPEIAELLGQADDQGGQTRRMAMTVLINALIFHEALAEAGFRIERSEPPPPGEVSQSDGGGPSQADSDQSSAGRRVHSLSHFRDSDYSYRRDALTDEWNLILDVNYWPIFATAREILIKLPIATVGDVLQPLWNAANQLVQGGVTKSHDLTGVIFQRLIADRKFLATFYTRPAAAALLAGLAIPADRAPGGAEWGDEETIAALQIGDFACGTGTLLSAAYQRISLLHELNGGDPRKLHAPMMKHGLVGLDVLNIAVHLTATMLAGAHPDVEFEGECLLTMPYGGDSASTGSLELLAEHVQSQMIQQAAAITAGGRNPQDVVDLMTRVGHGKFDLVIMNPPFTRQGGQEADRVGIGNAAFAAFETDRKTQDAMQKQLRRVSGAERLGSGNAGVAAHFVDLGLRKLRPGGTLAMVLPLSSMSGLTWDIVRSAIRKRCSDVTVVTIAANRSSERSFSADTGMAECLLVATKGGQNSEVRTHATFVVLNRQPASLTEGAGIASDIACAHSEGEIRSIEDSAASPVPIELGSVQVGSVTHAPLPETGPWPMVGIADLSLAQLAFVLEAGSLLEIGNPVALNHTIGIAQVGELGRMGPYDLDIRSDLTDGSPRGPFNHIYPMQSAMPTYPMLWNHDAQKERKLIVSPDSEGEVKAWPSDQETIDRKAAAVWATATRAHYNRDLRFNSQSLIVAMTERKCVGGIAWPSLMLGDPAHESAFSLWCNSTLGLLLHWWVTNKTQDGRGRTTITNIPNIPTLDTRALTDEQHAKAKRQFDLLRDERFLPFDQIDEDPARAKLDRAILVDVLGLPESLVEPGGPIDLIRRKLAREPQIHGGKKSRVVFTDKGEKSVPRDDRS
ncbi:MAG: hypothetical protein OXI09_07950 [Chloroflexota bacterium]|nr:hypothetical protein [Chloroflexota bacterium]